MGAPTEVQGHQPEVRGIHTRCTLVATISKRFEDVVSLRDLCVGAGIIVDRFVPEVMDSRKYETLMQLA